MVKQRREIVFRLEKMLKMTLIKGKEGTRGFMPWTMRRLSFQATDTILSNRGNRGLGAGLDEMINLGVKTEHEHEHVTEVDWEEGRQASYTYSLSRSFFTLLYSFSRLVSP